MFKRSSSSHSPSSADRYRTSSGGMFIARYQLRRMLHPTDISLYFPSTRSCLKSLDTQGLLNPQLGRIHGESSCQDHFQLVRRYWYASEAVARWGSMDHPDDLRNCHTLEFPLGRPPKISRYYCWERSIGRSPTSFFTLL